MVRRRMEPKTKTKCVVRGCGKEASGSRGMCQACYMAAWRRVNDGETSWPELEKKGLAKPRRPTREKRSAFSRALMN